MASSAPKPASGPKLTSPIAVVAVLGRACVHGPMTRRWYWRAVSVAAFARRPVKLRNVPVSNVSYQPVR